MFQTMDFDIAVLHLVKDEVKNERYSPVCLPSSNHVFHEGQSCWVTGWGTLSLNGRYYRVSQECIIVVRDLRYIYLIQLSTE